MSAAPAPVGIVEGSGNGEADAARAGRAVTVEAVVERAIPASITELVQGHVLFTRHDGVAQTVLDLNQFNTAVRSRPEGPVGFGRYSEIVKAVGAGGADVD